MLVALYPKFHSKSQLQLSVSWNFCICCPYSWEKRSRLSQADFENRQNHISLCAMSRLFTDFFCILRKLIAVGVHWKEELRKKPQNYVN